MNIAKAAISFEPRNTVNCLDLAVKFTGRRLRRVLVLWSLVALPAFAFVFFVGRTLRPGSWLSAVAFGLLLLATSPLGVLLALDGIPAAMGEPDTKEAFAARLRRLGPALLGRTFALRLVICGAFALCIIRGPLLPLRASAGLIIWLLISYEVVRRRGFLVEQTWFAEHESPDAQSRVKNLLRRSGGDLLVRSGWISLFCAGLMLSIFLLVDYTSSLFNLPVFVGRIAESLPSYDDFEIFLLANVVSDAFFLLTGDPLVLAVMTAVALFVYAIGRLAWFFCYVDVRVRQDLWNTELEFARLAARMKGDA